MATSLTLTIQEFNALMADEKQENVLFHILRKLSTSENPLELSEALRRPRPQATWVGWAL